MNHIDLFSGIGGFALAAKEVWGDAYNNVCFCDNNKFCQAVIRKNFGKESLIYGDIREVTRERIIADTNRARRGTPSSKTIKNGQEDSKKRQHPFPELSRHFNIDLLTGGFPCQPFSQAGKRRGTSDDRYLWPEMLRVIKDTSPRWIIAENVRGLLSIGNGVVFEQVCVDLEAIGYSVQPFIIPAVAVNAPHRRDRVWIVAHLSDNGCNRYDAPGSVEGKLSENKKQSGSVTECRDAWDENWLSVATRTCVRGIYDGIPGRIHGLTEAGHRVERLKALGNAIVPQVVIEIMRAIKQIDSPPDH